MSPQSPSEETRAIELLTDTQADRALSKVLDALDLAPYQRTGHGLGAGSWRLVQLNHRPGAGVTGVFAVELSSPAVGLPRHLGLDENEVLVCLSTAALPDDAAVVTLDWNGCRFASWLWPDDPWLPGLRQAADPTARLVSRSDLRSVPVTYRPTRRAVLRLTDADSLTTAYVKVVRAPREADLVVRHTVLANHHVPVPRPLARSGDGAVVLSHLPGPTAVGPIREEGTGVVAPEHLLALLDRFPSAVADFPRRAAWSDRALDYARSAQAALPEEGVRVQTLAEAVEVFVRSGQDVDDDGPVPVHGDFHPGNLILGPNPVDPALGPITGLLDLDAVGPGLLADDLACFVAHTWLLAIDPSDPSSVPSVVKAYLDAFDEVVDPVGLRVRTAGVLLSLIGVAGRRRGASAARAGLTVAESAYRLALV